MAEIVWSDAALARPDAIGTYIDQFNPQAASEVAAQLVVAGNSRAIFPHRGRTVPGTALRELVITIYPYTIRYRIVRDTVQILRIRHTSRRPS